jgi:hypothetical protein
MLMWRHKPLIMRQKRRVKRHPLSTNSQCSRRRAPCVLTNEHLRQLHFYHAGVAKQWYISDLSPDIPIDGSLLAGNGVNGVSAFVPVAVNDELVPLFIEFYMIDPLPLEAQNIPLDADVHILFYVAL